MCNQPVSNTTKYRFGTDSCNGLADRHYRSSDDHPGGLTRGRATSSDRQGVAGSKCSGSTKEECYSTHNSCLTMQSHLHVLCTSSCELKTVLDHSMVSCSLCAPTNSNADCAANNELAYTHARISAKHLRVRVANKASTASGLLSSRRDRTNRCAKYRDEKTPSTAPLPVTQKQL